MIQNNNSNHNDDESLNDTSMTDKIANMEKFIDRKISIHEENKRTLQSASQNPSNQSNNDSQKKLQLYNSEDVSSESLDKYQDHNLPPLPQITVNQENSTSNPKQLLKNDHRFRLRTISEPFPVIRRGYFFFHFFFLNNKN